VEEFIGLTAVVLLFGGGSAFLLAITPVGRAIADRIRGRPGLPPEAAAKMHEAQMAVLDEVDALRQDLADVQERLDFAERVLLKQRDAGMLPGGDPGQS
jgi:hypothetical protein